MPEPEPSYTPAPAPALSYSAAPADEPEEEKDEYGSPQAPTYNQDSPEPSYEAHGSSY